MAFVQYARKGWYGKPHHPILTLLTDTQLGDQSTIALDVLGHQVVQQLAALTDHLVQAAAAVVVLLVHTQVLGQLVDASGQDGHLDLGRTGVGLVGAVGLDNGRLFVLTDHGHFHLSFISLWLRNGRVDPHPVG